MVALGRTYRSVALVVEDEELDREVESTDRFEFLCVHVEAAVAVDSDGAATPAGKTCTYCGSDPEAHCTKPLRVQDALAFGDMEGLHDYLAAGSRTPGHDDVICVG